MKTHGSYFLFLSCFYIALNPTPPHPIYIWCQLNLSHMNVLLWVEGYDSLLCVCACCVSLRSLYISASEVPNLLFLVIFAFLSMYIFTTYCLVSLSTPSSSRLYEKHLWLHLSFFLVFLHVFFSISMSISFSLSLSLSLSLSYPLIVYHSSLSYEGGKEEWEAFVWQPDCFPDIFWTATWSRATAKVGSRHLLFLIRTLPRLYQNLVERKRHFAWVGSVLLKVVISWAYAKI